MPNLSQFREWLIRRGRERSVGPYCRVAKRYLDDPDQLFADILSVDHSPNYRRHLATCLKSYAKFNQDHALTEQLAELQLPAAAPATAREPFDRQLWKQLRDAIDAAGYLPPALRHVCALVAVRGIRCGDVLRLRRGELEEALKTGILLFEAKGGKRIQFSAKPLRAHLEGLLALPWTGQVAAAVCATGHPDTAGRRVRSAFDQIAVQSGLPAAEVYAHRFRHTYAAAFLSMLEGDPEGVLKLKDQMQWSRLETATNYLRRDRRKELQEIEDRLLDLDDIDPQNP